MVDAGLQAALPGGIYNAANRLAQNAIVPAMAAADRALGSGERSFTGKRIREDDEFESDKKLIIQHAQHGPLGRVDLVNIQQSLRLRKYFDRQFGIATTTSSWNYAANVPTTGTGNQLFSPILGIQINQREGRCCKVYKIECKVDWFIEPNDTTNATDCGSEMVRFALVQDKQWNASGFTPTIPWTRNHIHAWQSLINLGRFKVCKNIMERGTVIPYDHNGTSYLWAPEFRSTTITWEPKKPVDVYFTNITTETANAIQNTNWQLLIIGQVSNMTITHQTEVRVYFKDC